MSMNLMLELADPADAAEDWAAIRAVSQDGFVWLDEDTVTAVAKLLDGAVLANNESVFCYVAEDDDPNRSYVSPFGPSLLRPDMLARLRALLSVKPAAITLLDVVIERRLQITLQGKEDCDAHIKGVNWNSDDIEINRCSSTLLDMLETLVVPAGESEVGGQVEFETFARAVNDNGRFCGLRTDRRLQDFIACGRRNGAVAVRWA